MATWKKVIVSGSNAHLATVTASIALQVGTNQYITPSSATTYLSGSFSGSFFGNGANLTNISYSSIAAPSGIVSASVLAAGSGQGSLTLTTNGVSSGDITATTLGTGGSPTFAGLTISTNALAVNNTNGITTNAATFPIAPSATAITIGGSATNGNITLGNNTTSTVTIPGNLTVNGTTTIVNTTNLEVKDAFVLLASGSASSTTDGGIIVQGATQGTGSAFYWEGADSRWAVASNVAASATSLSPNSYVVTVSGSSFGGAQPSNPPTYGGATNGIGNIFIDTSLTATSDNNIWIYA